VEGSWFCGNVISLALPYFPAQQGIIIKQRPVGFPGIGNIGRSPLTRKREELVPRYLKGQRDEIKQKRKSS
jgi:hypothetical protein